MLSFLFSKLIVRSRVGNFSNSVVKKMNRCGWFLFCFVFLCVCVKYYLGVNRRKIKHYLIVWLMFYVHLRRQSSTTSWTSSSRAWSWAGCAWLASCRPPRAVRRSRWGSACCSPSPSSCSWWPTRYRRPPSPSQSSVSGLSEGMKEWERESELN